MAGAGHRHDLEGDGAVRVSRDDERLLALLGMVEERAVRESVTIRFIDNRYDAADRVDESDWEGSRHGDDQPECGRFICRYRYARASMWLPLSDRISRSVEHGLSFADDDRPLIEPVTVGSLTGDGDSDRRIRQLIVRSTVGESGESFVARTRESDRHVRSLPCATQPRRLVGAVDDTRRGEHGLHIADLPRARTLRPSGAAALSVPLTRQAAPTERSRTATRFEHRQGRESCPR
jgi:hypothetical protein